MRDQRRIAVDASAAARSASRLTRPSACGWSTARRRPPPARSKSTGRRSMSCRPRAPELTRSSTMPPCGSAPSGDAVGVVPGAGVEAGAAVVEQQLGEAADVAHRRRGDRGRRSRGGSPAPPSRPAAPHPAPPSAARARWSSWPGPRAGAHAGWRWRAERRPRGRCRGAPRRRRRDGARQVHLADGLAVHQERDA